MEIYDNILETLGNTPLVRSRPLLHDRRRNAGRQGRVLQPGLERQGPDRHRHDRGARSVRQARPGQTIVEPTSGNTGVGSGDRRHPQGLQADLHRADKIPPEKIALLEAYGAKVIVCPTNVAADDPRSYYKIAERIRDEEGAFLPYQYYNQANPQAHYDSTGPEIWRQTDGKITHWVAGIGTGGTISGTAKYLKEQNPDIRVIGVDTVGSVYGHYNEHGELPPEEQIHQYLIDGIGEDLLPESVWLDYIDEVITIDDKTAYDAVRRAAPRPRPSSPARRAAPRRSGRGRSRRRSPRTPRGHPLPRFGRALSLEAQRSLDAREGSPGLAPSPALPHRLRCPAGSFQTPRRRAPWLPLGYGRARPAAARVLFADHSLPTPPDQDEPSPTRRCSADL